MIQAAHRFDNNLRYRDEDHPNQTAFTPEYVLTPVRECFGGQIALDPCTTPDNPCAAKQFYSPPDDGVMLPWRDGTFVNPPYGKARERWVHRCMGEGTTSRRKRIILLIPAHTDTRIFQRALSSATAAVFIQGRLKFGILRPNRRQVAASHPSVLIGWNVDLTPCKSLGILVKRA